jgi:histidyl-tRNA synthetase
MKAEMMYKVNPKFLNQIQYCERESIPLMIVVGEEEKGKGGVKLRDVVTQQEVFITLENLVEEIKRRLHI